MNKVLNDIRSAENPISGNRKIINTIAVLFLGIVLGIFSKFLDFRQVELSSVFMAIDKSDEPTAVIQNWMRGRDVIEFLGLWESLHNPDFKPLEFEGFKSQAGANAFTMSPKKWIESTNAIGIVSKSGRYGGTYAHSDIAFEFASWISPEFKLYIIKDYNIDSAGKISGRKNAAAA